jgi:hypothetical protein
MLRETALNEVAVSLSEVKVMSVKSQYTCWEIIRCGNKNCAAYIQPNTPCWEIADKLDDYRTALNICSDCIVYLSQQKNSILSPEEIEQILEKKKVCFLREHRPRNTD